ncbi:hypothetical protein PULV_a3087 [Pseudoalteromonas ulvae UL12]|uniref:hypothetical protein n=1 Tax=Pseudoalteromonas ulvae TaxID=107327 RepID=UPI00186BABB7|nr:hypothetical protein [Pseudoalteromonas ulvae]MBE0362450.1 hypothetical protein [Pseudoalteromonas ulvae UL12]
MKIQSPTDFSKSESSLVHQIESIAPSKKVANDLIMVSMVNTEVPLYRKEQLKAVLECLSCSNLLSRCPTTILKNLNNSKVNKNKFFERAAKNIFIILEENSFLDTVRLNDWDYFRENFEINNKNRLYILRKELELCSPTMTFFDEVISFLSTKKAIKNYLNHYVEGFKEIHSIDPDFTAEGIREGLITYKTKLIEEGPINSTVYGKFNNLRSLFNYLKKIQLVPTSCIIPKGFDRPANTNKQRITNPTISPLNIHCVNGKEIKPTKEYINQYHESLKKNLELVLGKAKDLISKAYSFYYYGSDVKEELSKANVLSYKKGMTRELVAALQTVIVNEIGINPTSLYSACIVKEKKKSSSLAINPDGTATLRVVKWRARHIRRSSPETASLVSPEELNHEKINSSFCLQFALEMRSRSVAKMKSNKLWVFVTKKQEISDNTKHGDANFKYFYSNYLSNNSLPSVNLYKIRHSRAVEIYIATNGDSLKVANYLGNKVKTALNTYIPHYLQEGLYRNKLSNFQNLYLLLATADLPEKLEVLGMSEKQYNQRIIEVLENPDWGGELFEILKPQVHNKESNEVFFICSKENFEYALKIVEQPDCEADDKTIEVCKKALLKAGNSPMPIQRMLFSAKRSLKEKH